MTHGCIQPRIQISQSSDSAGGIFIKQDGCFQIEIQFLTAIESLGYVKYFV